MHVPSLIDVAANKKNSLLLNTTYLQAYNNMHESQKNFDRVINISQNGITCIYVYVHLAQQGINILCVSFKI